jgi:hypothetical protein
MSLLDLLFLYGPTVFRFLQAVEPVVEDLVKRGEPREQAVVHVIDQARIHVEARDWSRFGEDDERYPA